MLRRRFLLNGEDSTPDYIITYYANDHVNFLVDNNLNKKLYFISLPYESDSETRTPFKLVLDTFNNGVGQWGFKSINSQPLTTYGPVITDSDGVENPTKVGIFNLYITSSGFVLAGDINAIVFPQGLTSCGLTFTGFPSNVSEISLPSSLQTIPNFAFVSTAITNITIPPNVTRIGSGAFGDNTLLTDVTLLGVDAPNIDGTCSQYFPIFNDYYIQNIYVPYPESYLTTSEWYYYKDKIKLIPGIFKWNGGCSFTHISGDEYGGTAGKYMIPTTPVTVLTSGSIRTLDCDVLEFPETLTKVVSDFCWETEMHKLTKVVWNAPTCEVEKYFNWYNVFDHIQDLTLTDTVQVCPSFFYNSPNLNHFYIGRNVQTIPYFPKSNYITWTSDKFQTTSTLNVHNAWVFIDELCLQFPSLSDCEFISPVHMLTTRQVHYAYCHNIDDFYSSTTNKLVGLLIVSPTINSNNWIDECSYFGVFGLSDISVVPHYKIDVPTTLDTMIQIPINSESVNIPSNIVYSPQNLWYWNSNYTINGGFIKFDSCYAENSESIVNLVDIGKWCSSFELSVNTIVSKCKDLLINGVATDKIIIPEGVIKITELPFGSRHISEITIPSTVKLCGQILDRYSHIDKITWNTKTLNSFSFGLYIFYLCDCPNVVIGDSVEQIPCNFMLDNNELLQITIPSNVKEIGCYAFNRCENLTDVSFSEGLEAIGDYAFYKTNIASVTLPSTIKYLGYQCFTDTPWYDNLPDGPIYINNIFYDYKGTAPEVLTIEPGTTAIAGGACMMDTNIKQVILPDTLLTIGASAFQDSNVAQINIPDSVEFIGSNAFAGCPFFTYDAALPYMYVDNHLFIWDDVDGLEIRSGTKTMNVCDKRRSSSSKIIMNIQTNEELISIVHDLGYTINMHVNKNVKYLPPRIQGTLTVHSENPYYTDCGVGVIMSKDTCELYANGKCTVIPDCVKSIRKLGVLVEDYIEIPKSVQFIESNGIIASAPFTLKYLGTKNDFYLNVCDISSIVANLSNITFIFNDV